jgi:hypothetical protein
MDTQTKLWETETELRATTQTWSGDLDTQTKLWETEADPFRATVSPDLAGDLDTHPKLWGGGRDGG